MKLLSGTDTISIRPAEREDAPFLAGLYRTIAVTRENYRQVLGDGERSFARCGGMFEISSEERLRQVIEDPQERIIVGAYNDKPCAMLWYGMAKEGLFHTLHPVGGFEGIPAFLTREIRAKRMGYAEEIISIVEGCPHVMPFALFCAMMEDYSAAGIPHTTGEVFEVTGYDDEEGHAERSLLNGASFRFLMETGGDLVGCTAPKTVKLDGFSVHICPKVFLWDTASSTDVLKKILSEKGWRRP